MAVMLVVIVPHDRVGREREHRQPVARKVIAFFRREERGVARVMLQDIQPDAGKRVDDDQWKDQPSIRPGPNGETKRAEIGGECAKIAGCGQNIVLFAPRPGKCPDLAFSLFTVLF